MTLRTAALVTAAACALVALAVFGPPAVEAAVSATIFGF